jgi:iron complex transport system ATP-binding protein
MGAIEIRNLSWNFENKSILKNIYLNFEKGEFTSILGPNGSGKTTLLRTISTWLKPRKGTIYLEGKDVLLFSSKELSKHMAFVPQNTNIDFEFSALDIVLMGRWTHLKNLENEGLKDLEIAREAMNITNTWEFRDRTINTLSGGERQRVIIARALATQAKILIMDEPVSNLDIYHQMEILNIIKSLQHDKKLTVVTVLHDVNLASQYSDKIVFMKDGFIKSYGVPEKVLTRENINDVYDIDVYMTRHPVMDCPYVIPLYTNKKQDTDNGKIIMFDSIKNLRNGK